MKKLLLFMFVICTGISVSAQTTISGKVTFQGDNSALPGVSVTVKGTALGTATDNDGNFSISIPTDKAVLIFKYVGFKEQQISVSDNSKNLKVAMSEDTQLLNEVVVVGYGTMKKSDISGASSSLGEDKIKGSIIANLDQALQGRVAGVNSVLTSGAPGSAVSIRVRGTATINADAEPLYVIDGVIVQKQGTAGGDANYGYASQMVNINPADILTMEILKDASATAIYGSQGANGVVLITTKRGKSGEAKFSYDGNIGMNIQGKRLKMMNLREYADYVRTVNDEYGTKPSDLPYPEYQDPSLLGAGTNWQDAIFQNALIQNHEISARGGSDKVTYYISGGYMGQEGTIIGTDFKRFSFRTNLDAQMKSWLKVGVDASYASTAENFTLANGDEGVLTYSLITPPDVQIYDIDGNYSSVTKENYYKENAIGKAMIETHTLDRTKLTGRVYMDVTPIKNLVWHSQLGFDFSQGRRINFFPTYDFGNISNSINSMDETKESSSYYSVINHLTYSGKYQKHSYTLMLGEELWESSNDNLNGKGSGLLSNDIHSLSLADPNSYTALSGFGSSSMVSFFTRETYNYDDRYLGTFTYRRDGSSNFGPENRWANFFSFAASWRFSNEAFLKDQSVLSNGKFRIGWGQTGNASIGGYKWGASIRTPAMPTDVGPGYRQNNIANPYIHWETQKQWNLGLDLGFFKDRINLTIDAYDKTSGDMLMQADLPSYMGTKGNGNSALNPPYGNYGSINNKGLEFSLNTQNLKGAFEWETDFQISFNKNKLLSLAPGTPPIMGYPQWGGMGSAITLTEVGQPLYNFYGFVTDGYYKDKDDIEKSPKTAGYKGTDGYNLYNSVWVGDIKFKDLNGDGVIDDKDRTNLGSPFPKFDYGMTNTFRFKNFELSIFFQGSYGNKLFNYEAIGLTSMSGVNNNQLRSISGRATFSAINPNKTYDGTNGVWNWFQDIDNVRMANNPTMPRAVQYGDPNQNQRFSDRYIEDGSYLRIKNISLGYTVPTKLTHKYHLDNVRIYTNIQNLLTFTHYTGYDPEVGVNTMTSNVYGMDNGRYPSPQSYTLGLNISF